MKKLLGLIDGLPSDLAQEAVTHASWVQHKAESYERLAFLGDSVLALAITSHLYPMLDASDFGAGKLTKIRAQVVSGRSCREVAERLDVPDRLRSASPDAVTQATKTLVQTERVLASVVEALIGACFLQYGYTQTAEAVVETFNSEIDQALKSSTDFKSALQELLARDGEVVVYEVTLEEGPPHARSFEVAAVIAGKHVSQGAGRSKKDAEQAAAAAALEKLV